MPFFRELEQSIPGSNTDIKSIQFNEFGLMHLLSNNGIYTYDGLQFFKIAISQDEVFTSAYFSDSFQYIGTQSGLFMIYQIENGKYVLKKKYKLNSKINKIIRADDGAIWIASLGSGVYCFSNNKLSSKINSFLSNESYVYDLINYDNKIWMATDAGLLYYLNNTCYLPAKLNRVIADPIVYSIAINKDNLFVASDKNGLYRYDVISTDIFKVEGSESWGILSKMVFLKSELWAISSDSGLVNIGVSQNYYYNKINSTIQHEIIDINIDHEGNVWLCTKDNKLYNFNFSFSVLNVSKPFLNITALYKDKSSRLWIADNGGLYYYLNQLKEVSIPEDLNITCITEDQYGNIWFGTFDKGLYQFIPKSYSIRKVNTEKCLVNDNVLSMASSMDTLWVATLGGVTKLVLDSVKLHYNLCKNYDKFSGLGSNFIYQVYIDSRDRVWFATDGNGVTLYENGKLINYNNFNSKKKNVVYTIAEDSKGNLWFNNAKYGLYKFEANTIVEYGNNSSLRTKQIAGIVADDYNKLLLFTNKGVDVLNTRYSTMHFHDSEFGFIDFDPNINVFHKVKNKPEIWFASQHKIYLYQQEINELLQGPVSKINVVEINGKKYYKHFPSVLEYDENYLGFDFLGVWYHEPSEIKYKYKLEGYDLNWIITSDKHVSYSKLPAGKYVFKLASSISDNENVGDFVSYEFEIKKPFWQSLWFLSLSLVSLVALVYFVFKWRIRTLKRKSLIEKERINSELRTLKEQIKPHFLFNAFNALIGIIETDSDTAVKYVEHLSDFYRKILVYKDSDSIHLREELELLQHYVYILKQRFGNKLLVDVQIAEEYLSTKIVPFSLQLLIENAIKHNEVSREHPLTVELRMGDGFLVIKNKIQKLKSDVQSTGTGLKNISARYQFLFNVKIVILNNSEYFEVHIPLIYEHSNY